MSFGKRTIDRSVPRAGTPQQRLNIETPNWQARGLAVAFLKYPLMFAFSIAIYFTGQAAYVAGMKHLGHKLNQKFEAQVEQTRNPTPQLAMLNIRGADGWSYRSCTMREPLSARDEAMRLTGSHDEKSDRFGVGGNDETMDLPNEFESKTAFLECVARDEVKQLCDPTVRSAFIKDAISVYRDQAATSGAIFGSNASAKKDPGYAAMMRELENAQPGFLSGQDTAIENSFAQSHDSLLNALKVAAEDGVITASNAGFFAPKEIKTALQISQPAKKTCK